MLRSICLFLTLFYFTSFGLQAEPFYPLLKKATIDNIQAQLQKGKADTNRVNLLVLLSQHFVLSSESDSAYNYTRKAEILSNILHFRSGQIRTKYLLSQIEAKKGNYKQAKDLAKAGISLSNSNQITTLKAEGWYLLGGAYPPLTEAIPEKIKCLEKSRILYQQINNTGKEAFILKAIANCHYLEGKSPQAIQDLLQVLSMYRSINYVNLHYTYDMLVAVNRNLGNYKEAIQYSLASIESSKTTKDTQDLPLFYGRLGLIYDEINQYKDGMKYHQKAFRQYQLTNNRLMMQNITLHITLNLLAQNKPQDALAFCLKTIKAYPPDNPNGRYAIARSLAESYKALKQYEPAEKYYLEMLRLEELRPIKDINVYLSLANFYITVKQYSKARRYLDKATILNASAGSVRSSATLELLLFKEDSTKGDLQAAIAHHQRYKALTDSVFNETKSKQIASLQIQYETKEKEQQINLLNKQSQVQQTRIRQREIQRNTTIIGAALLLLLTGVIYNRYRLKQHSNQLLEAKQLEINQKNQSLVQVLLDKEELLEEKEWMVKEIHHRVKNNLQIISGLLYSQSTYLQDLTALTAIRESQNRVHAMALIHQKLYQSNNLDCVPMQAYIEEIVAHLLESFNIKNKIEPLLNVTPLDLDISLAVPIGLIINEAITNSIKYAFPGDQPGVIEITLNKADSKTYLLIIKDNGIGLPAGFDPQQSRSLGMSMIQGLSRQIKANLQIYNSNGVEIILVFNPVKLSRSQVILS